MSDDSEVYGVVPLYPQGTNSTIFTDCCHVAICNDQPKCPRCGSLIVGHDAGSDHKRSQVRWTAATRSWNRSPRS